MSYNIFGSGPNPKVFNSGAQQNNKECCDSPNDNILNCADVMACVNLNLFSDMNAPFMPYFNGVGLQDSWLYYDSLAGATRMSQLSILATHASGQAQINSNGLGDRWTFTTDGGAGGESVIQMFPTQNRIGYGANSYITFDTATVTLFHNVRASILAPLVNFQTGTMIESGTTGLTSITFGAADNEFNVTTDGTTASESGLSINPVQWIGYTVDGSIDISNPILTVFHTTDISFQSGNSVYVNSPLLEVIDTGKFDVDTLAGTYAMFDTNASVVSMGRAGATFNVNSTLAMLSAQLQLAPGAAGYASMTMPIGIAPAAPVNGDMWFDGTNLFMRIGGVSVVVI